MKITKLSYNTEYCNSYIIGEEGQDCILIDPGYNKNHVLENYIKKHHRHLLGILITHGHFDHIRGLENWEGLSLTPLFMGEPDLPCLEDPKLNVSDELEGQILSISALNPYPIEDEDEIKLGSFVFKAIATPFHTIGSVCYYVKEEKTLFSGDTLFRFGIGRSDLPGSSPRSQRDSLAKLRSLPPDTKVYPGHGPATTIGAELACNEDFN
jgi:hydroxyacylglutathione hydrolase